MSPLRVCVVIVNYKTAGLTLDCLASLEADGLDGIDVIVVDNESGDGSLERLSQEVTGRGWQGWCRVVAAGRNAGFAAGNNVGIRLTMQRDEPPEAVHLLNPDTYVRPGAVHELRAFLAQHERAGIAGSQLENPDGSVRRAAFRFPTVLSEFEGQARLGPVSALLSRWVVAPPLAQGPSRMGWVSGASLMVRRSVIERIGLMDESYFLYFEETDYCLAVARAGYEVWHVPASRVVHLVGQSTGVNRPGEVKPRPRYWYESRRRYFVKNHGRLVADLADAGLWLGRGVNAAARLVMPGRTGDGTVQMSAVRAARRGPGLAAGRGLATGPGASA
jgi:hypothetical protein